MTLSVVARPCPPGLAGVDLDSVVTPAIAAGFKAEGKRFVLRYGKVVLASEVDAITSLGMGVGFLTFGRSATFSATTGAQDVQAICDHLRSQQIPLGGGLTLGMDLEDPTGATIAEVLEYEKAGARAAVAADCSAGDYIGAGLLMTSAELTSMGGTHYYKSGSKVVDASGAVAEPAAGWVLTQVLPFDQPCGGALVDYDFSGHDFKGRSWFMLWAVTSGRAYSIPVPDTARESEPPSSAA